MMVGIRELKNRATQIIRTLQERGVPVVVSRHGRPAALILPIDCPEAEDYVLAHAPDIVRGFREADRDLKAGRTITAAEYRRQRGL